MVAKGLLLKGGAGFATAATSSLGIWWGVDHIQNQMTKFDRGLIDFLNDGGKIQFAVSSGNDTTLSNFPAFTDSSTKLTATVKVTISTGTSGTSGTLTEKNSATDGDKGTKKYLAKLNGNEENGTDWTWTCEIEFTKDTGNSNDLTDDYKNRLVKANDEKGFFNRLKENNDSEVVKDREQKIKFIRDCAKARGKDKNREINKLNDLKTLTSSANELKSLKKFKLRDGKSENTGEDTSKLYPEDKWEFDNWFPIKKTTN